jgi:hypothetical protein
MTLDSTIESGLGVPLQSDSSRRPSMSIVAKVLEGVMTVETCAYHNFFLMHIQ